MKQVKDLQKVTKRLFDEGFRARCKCSEPYTLLNVEWGDGRYFVGYAGDFSYSWVDERPDLPSDFDDEVVLEELAKLTQEWDLECLSSEDDGLPDFTAIERARRSVA